MTDTSTTEDRALERARALLEKAETISKQAKFASSEELQNEADAAVRLAQVIMTKHAIDEMAVRLRMTGGHVNTARSIEYVTRQVPLNNPFTTAKSILGLVVAESNRCKVIISSNGGTGRNRLKKLEFFGTKDDVDFVELLYTGILGQLVAESSRASRDGRSSGAAWQNAFYHGYAQRVGERLRENARVAAEEVDESSDLLPVLANDLNAAHKAHYGRLSTKRATGPRDRQGMREGLSQGEKADISGGRGPRSTHTITGNRGALNG